MKIRWCWRCQMEIPMLEAHEWELVTEARQRGMHFVKEEMKKRGIRDYQPLELESHRRRHRVLLEMYWLLTGLKETNPNAVWHHIVDLYGPDCPQCRRPLRTPVARYCAECGFGKDDFTSQDTKPLVERRPELFK